MKFIAVMAAIAFQALSAGQSSDAPVRAVLDEQVRAWNQGDLSSFVRKYSEDALFVGREVTRGAAGVLERYRRNYPNRERMGILNFTEVEVRMLGRDFASVLGRYHLRREAAASGPADGVFTLLLKRSGQKWLIILDHTS